MIAQPHRSFRAPLSCGLCLVVLAVAVGCDRSSSAPRERAPAKAPDTSAITPPSGEEDTSGAKRDVASSQDSAASSAPTSLDDSDPVAMALGYCALTQGPIPHWLLIERLEEALVVADRPIARRLYDETRATIGDEEWPRQLAVQRFLSSRTECRFHQREEVDGGTVKVHVDQRLPIIKAPEGKVAGLEAAADPESRARVWEGAFASAYEPSTHGVRFALTLRREGASWRVDAGLVEGPGELLRVRGALFEARGRMDARDWLGAQEVLEGACPDAGHEDECASTGGRLREGLEAYERLAEARAATEVRMVKARAVGVGGAGQSRTVLEVEVSGGGEVGLDEVWVEAVGLGVGGVARDRQVCLLREARHAPTQGAALKVAAGEVAVGYCALRVGARGVAQQTVSSVPVDVR